MIDGHDSKYTSSLFIFALTRKLPFSWCKKLIDGLKNK